MTDLPAPLTPANCDLTDFPAMMIDITRLRQSSFDAILDDSAWRAGINLWLSAWHSVPAGSLANDDGALTKAAGLGRDIRTWQAVRDDALRGFIECSDGRLYHTTVCEVALEAWIEKLLQRLASGVGNARRWSTEFDAEPIEQDLELAGRLLAAITPDSKSLMKTRRRLSRGEANNDPATIPPGSKNDRGGSKKSSAPIEKPQRSISHRDKVPIGILSQEKGREEKGYKEPPLPPEPDPPIINSALRKVIEAAGMSQPPRDAGLLTAWIKAGGDLDTQIIPAVEAAARSLLDRTGKAPFTLKVLDQDVRTKISEDAKAIENHRKAIERNERQLKLQAEQDAQEETPEQAAARRAGVAAAFASGLITPPPAEGTMQ